MKTSTGTRSTFATRVNKGGADIVTLKELLGHSDVKMTMRYAHKSRGAKAQSVRSLLAGGGKVVTKARFGQKSGKIFVVTWTQVQGNQVVKMR